MNSLRPEKNVLWYNKLQEAGINHHFTSEISKILSAAVDYPEKTYQWKKQNQKACLFPLPRDLSAQTISEHSGAFSFLSP